MEDKKEGKLQPDNERTVFVPGEEIQAIEGVLDKMEQAQQKFRKVAEEMKHRDNEEWEMED